jgi:phage terminase large subunit
MAVATAGINEAERQLLELALEIGLPTDALDNFEAGDYCPQAKQLEFHAACRAADLDGGPTQIGFGGARGPGKSHGLFAQVALDDCQRVEGLKCLYLRKIGKNAREQFEDLRRAVLRFTDHEFKTQAGTVLFPNGSRVLIGHFNNESDIDNYLGLEYDLIAIEEATTLTESKYKALRDSNRTSKTNWRPRIYCTTNPGGVGHAWFKKRFIEPARKGCEVETRFIFATVDDNVFLDRDYVNKLDENTGWKLKAYRHGDWDIAAGQFFTTFRFDVHAIDATDIPILSTDIAEYWGSLDYGWNHYTVFHLFMKHDGMVYVISEHSDRLMSVDYHAKAILALLARHGLYFGDLSTCVAGTDVFAQRGAKNAETIADQYDTDRINGWGQILKLLGDPDRNIAEKIKISRNCVRLLETLPVLEHDPKRPEDVKKVDTDESGNGGDDAGDCFRYGVMVNNSLGITI